MPARIDMTGWKMSEHGVPDSRLTVIKPAPSHQTTGGHSVAMWQCKCECGKYITARGNHLRNGNTKSCGCLSIEIIIKNNIARGEEIKIGERFGKLVVIKDLGMKKQKSRNKNWRWSLCQCDCGSNPIEVPNNLLKSGHKLSCGCISSLGEYKIEKILKEYNIIYQKEFIFKNLLSPSGTPYRFDFAIFDNFNNLLFLLEFDGRQHYSGPESSWKNTRTLEEIQYADQLKNQYCIKNNIILKRIPQFQISKISYETIFSNDFIIEDIKEKLNA